MGYGFSSGSGHLSPFLQSLIVIHISHIQQPRLVLYPFLYLHQYPFLIAPQLPLPLILDAHLLFFAFPSFPTTPLIRPQASTLMGFTLFR
ncbi:hypothetical protein RJT34_15648 [Clitoria ternatea]|uniref:Uncharacterized protein n=1 Tax=Clitoria ternatea TaxID=43366 RepID=A0AAN9J8S3_CLITE